MNGLRQLSLMALVAGLMVFSGQNVEADDIDIYLRSGEQIPNSEPIVIFSLDYRPNLNSTVCQNGECDFLVEEGWLLPAASYTFFDMLRAVLRKVMDPLEDVRVGLMLNHDHVNEAELVEDGLATGVRCAGPEAQKVPGCSNGGYIAMDVEPFLADDANGAKARFHEILANIPLPEGDQSHSWQGKELFFELYRYLTGQGVYNGHVGYTDYASDPNLNLDQESPEIAWDEGAETADNTTYVSPLGRVGECTRIFTVNSLFFVANQDDDSDEAIAAPLAEGGTGASPRGFPDMLQFLNDIDLADGSLGTAPDVEGKQSVTSYFLVDPTKINKTTVGYAQSGNTGQPLPLDEDPRKLIATLQDVIKQILSVSTTFVAASVPVNVFNRAEVVDNVYLALFQADAEGQPAWVGNVKKLKLAGLADGSENVRLVDALGQTAVAGDGRIRFDALTFWTNPADLPAPLPERGEVEGRDGRSVDRGGAGQHVPGLAPGEPGMFNAGWGSRQVYYDDGGQLLPLDVDEFTALRLDPHIGLPLVMADRDAAMKEMLMYARGLDVDDLDIDGDFTEGRRWLFGDPLHSRPLPINYGALGSYSASNPAIFLAVASNDGYLHFIRNTNSDGSESGQEEWAFMPTSIMGVLPELRANVANGTHPYTVDGSPVAYIEDIDGDGNIEAGDHVYLFFGLRRGGKHLYALDVTDPRSPSLMWHISKADGDFSELAMTFSTPRVGLVDLGTGPLPVLVFAGGYDVNKDLREGVGTDDAEGNALFVVNAKTGDLIWKAVGKGVSSASEFVHADLVDSIPSPVALADMDGDGLIDRAVVGDTGGNVWRADLTGSDTGNWKMTLLASLGRHSNADGKAGDRRFFHRPDLVQSRDAAGPFDAVVLGSGDRADPLDLGGTTNNFFYMIKDRNIGTGAGADSGLTHADLADVTDNCLQAGTCVLNLTKGWRLRLEEDGEKNLATPVTIAGSIFFTTYLPRGGEDAGACAPSEGTGRIYAVALQNAFAVRNYNAVDDDPDMPGEPTTKDDRSKDLNSYGIPAEVVAIPPQWLLRPDLTIEDLSTSMRWRTFWYEAEDQDL